MLWLKHESVDAEASGARAASEIDKPQTGFTG